MNDEEIQIFVNHLSKTFIKYNVNLSNIFKFESVSLIRYYKRSYKG